MYIETIALDNKIKKLAERIAKLENEPLAKLVKSTRKNTKIVLAYDNRVEAIVVFFSKRLEKLEKNREVEIEEARYAAFDDAISSEARDE